MRIETWGPIAMIVVPLVLFFILPISDPDLHYEIGAVLCFATGVAIVLIGGSLIKRR